jgi:hypothetical protein
MRAEAATIFLVHPLSAFTSAVHSSANTLRVASPPFDALQLAWLLAQLNLDMPRYSDALLGPTRAAQVGALALIPVALAVGEEAKQTELSQPALKKTLLTWLPKCNANTTDTLWQWWEVYRDTRPLWPTALAALDRMLEATVSPPPQTV